MGNEAAFEIEVSGGLYKKSIEDCIKDFENELEIIGLKTDIINVENSLEILNAYVNSETFFLELIKRKKEVLQKLLPQAKVSYLNELSIGLLKVIIVKFHHNLFQKEIARELAFDVSHHAISCMEKRTGIIYLDDNCDSSFAKKGAAAKNKENRELKKDVFQWLDKNMHLYKTMDDAAFFISKNFVPMAFRTVRQWITEWNKLRAAGTK